MNTPYLVPVTAPEFLARYPDYITTLVERRCIHLTDEQRGRAVAHLSRHIGELPANRSSYDGAVDRVDIIAGSIDQEEEAEEATLWGRYFGYLNLVLLGELSRLRLLFPPSHGCQAHWMRGDRFPSFNRFPSL